MPHPPTGTVTFVFTDIEGSTRLWERFPEHMRPALERHDAIVRAAIEKHAGFVFKTLGDGFCAAFVDAAAAVAAALELQRAVEDEPWHGIPIRVRAALHAGAASLRDGDYFGPPLNRVARLRDAGHGGQVLLTQTAAELVRNSLPEGVTLRDLGLHRLRDLTDPERIFQLQHASLARDFPALRTLDARPNNLPAPATPLVGRQHELAALRERLVAPATRVVTLTGPGGSGKTRLALQVASHLLAEFDDGAWFVDLAPIAAAVLLPATVARALNLRELPGRALHEALADHLRERRVLLVLDNFEHLRDAAPAVSALLAEAPRTVVLATSRVPLHVYGEHEFPVPPLSLPASEGVTAAEALRSDAVRLFVERAAAVRSGFALTDDTAPDVVDICQRLDGLPLAVELAAARVKVFAPPALRARLQHRLDLLSGGASDLPERQRTMRAAVRWSYDLLSEDEQPLFRRLAVFPGGFTLSSAEALLNRDAPPALADHLCTLVDHSLLRIDDREDTEPAFRMLETIREYALERLAECGEDAAWRDRLADWALDLAARAEPELTGPRQAAWLATLQHEHDNLRAALDWLTANAQHERAMRLAASLPRFWRVRGHLAEGRARLEGLLVHEDIPAPLRALALREAGWLTRDQGDYAAARRYADESLHLSRALDDRCGAARALLQLGFVARYEGAHDAAMQRYGEALEEARASGDLWCQAASLGSLGLLARDRGAAAESERLLDESLAVATQIGDALGIAWVLTNLGLAARAQGRLADARERLQRALTIWRQLGDRQNIAYCAHNLGLIDAAEGDAVAAHARQLDALRILSDVGDRRGVAFVLESLALLAVDACDPECAAVIAGAAAALRHHLTSAPPPAWRQEYETALAAGLAAMQPAARELAFDRGRAMSHLQAITYAVDSAAPRAQHEEGSRAE